MKKKVDLEMKTTDGVTPLMLACFSPQLKLVKLLVEKFKVDIDRKGFSEFKAIDFADISGCKDIVRYLESRGSRVANPEG